MDEFYTKTFSDAIDFCAENGGIENPLTITPILSDENYLDCSFWQIPESDLKEHVRIFTMENVKNKRQTG